MSVVGPSSRHRHGDTTAAAAAAAVPRQWHEGPWCCLDGSRICRGIAIEIAKNVRVPGRESAHVRGAADSKKLLSAATVEMQQILRNF